MAGIVFVHATRRGDARTSTNNVSECSEQPSTVYEIDRSRLDTHSRVAAIGPIDTRN